MNCWKNIYNNIKKWFWNSDETKISLEGDRYMSEEMKSKIIKYAMRKIGTQRISILDGMTLEYENKWYNIYVNGNEVTVEEI